MKNLIFAVFTVLFTLSLNAQIEIPTEILTPAMVNQNNSMVKSNSLLAQARRNYLAGKKLPAGIILITTLEDRVGAFTKNNSRQMISDGAWIAKRGTDFFYQESTQSLHYVYCLNRVRTFQKLSSLVEPKIIYKKGETIFLPAKKEVVKEEQRFDMDPTPYIQPQITCDDVVNAWDKIQANYTRRMINRKWAKSQFNQLQYQYSNCVAGFRPVWRNDGVKTGIGIGLFVGGYYLGRSNNRGNNNIPFIPDHEQDFAPNHENDSRSSATRQNIASNNVSSSRLNSSSAASRGMQQYKSIRAKGVSSNKSYVQSLSQKSSSFISRRVD